MFAVFQADDCPGLGEWLYSMLYNPVVFVRGVFQSFKHGTCVVCLGCEGVGLVFPASLAQVIDRLLRFCGDTVQKYTYE